MKIRDIWKKLIGLFSNQTKSSNIKFIDDSSQQQKTIMEEQQTEYKEQIEEGVENKNS